MNKRSKPEAQASFHYPHWATVLVRPSGSTWTETEDVPLADIQIVRLASEDGSLDIVYTVRRRLPSGITVNEIKSGETDMDQLLIALGWQPGMSCNEHLTELTDLGFRIIT